MTIESEASKQIVAKFWATMQTNEFQTVAELLHDDYILEWPQSGERVRGRANFVAINENYPAQGRWEFTIHRILSDGDQVVSDVGVTDGVIQARVITFSTIRDGKIIHQIEFWPDPFEPAAWRAKWVERM
jgi:ketosteroid isomerase-like protein